jgi:predicted nucleic acid-binding protein
MRFWDSSAIAPLIASEPSSGPVQELLRSDPQVVVWWGARLECVSALRRREREGALDAAAVEQATGLLDTLADAWSEVLPSDLVRAQAERALAVHPLRAADSLQLAAALTWRREPARQADFVCLDYPLRDAAAREGFTLLPPAPSA